MVASLEDVRVYIEHGTCPDNADKILKRRIRERAESFKVAGDDILYIGRKVKEALVITDEGRRVGIIKEMHCGIIGGCHYGQNATIAKVSDRSWWAGLAEDVRGIVRLCEACQKANPLNRPPAATLHPISVKHVFHRRGIDLVGPLQ